MRSFRYSNKRIGKRLNDVRNTKRLSNGRFARVTFRDIFEVDPNNAAITCKGCGHVWSPILKTGRCPECNLENGLNPNNSASYRDLEVHPSSFEDSSMYSALKDAMGGLEKREE
jgi:hypothetical protein